MSVHVEVNFGDAHEIETTNRVTLLDLTNQEPLLSFRTSNRFYFGGIAMENEINLHDLKVFDAALGSQNVPLQYHNRQGTLYEILGVNKDATKEVIRVAYRKLALKWHPDRHEAVMKKEAQQRFQTISNAYQILLDDNTRRRYDECSRNQEPFEETHTTSSETAETTFNQEFASNLADILNELHPSGEHAVRDAFGWGALGSVAFGISAIILFTPAVPFAVAIGSIAGGVKGYTGKDVVTNYNDLSDDAKYKLRQMLFERMTTTNI